MDPFATLDIAPCAIDDALSLQRDLGVSFAVAQVLVRRGINDTEAARQFLAADTEHPASAFDGIDVAVATILTAVSASQRVTVHGDYDVDGVTSTAILVRALRSIGADVDWFLPSRTEDGYGLSAQTVERLAERGTGLLLLTDCGITAVDEVAAARGRGMGVVVVDHHSPRADGLLPDAPIVHPSVGGYPCPDLCAAGVAFKLAGALLTAAGHDAAITLADLDLVALATVADCVPLVGENRRLVRQGLRALSRTEKPGLRALMRVTQLEPQRISARDIGFRLAPRLNAAGRVSRADAALELLLTHDEGRANEIAQELDEVNSRRRFEETRILHEAEAQVAALGERPAYVLSGECWHPGVIGIVASRIAERHHRPTLVVAFNGDLGTGSGRSIPGVDLLAGLTAAGPALERFGGHRAAAGCTVSKGRLNELSEAFVGHFAATLTDDDLLVRSRVDAVVGGDELGQSLAEEMERLAPFGIGNPSVSLLVPAARLVEPRPIGQGKHLRFTVEAGGVKAQAVAFGVTSLPEGAEAGRVHSTFTLELNEFRGAVEPRLVLRQASPFPNLQPVLVGEPEPGTAEWSQTVLTAARAGSRSLVGVSAGTGPSGRHIADPIGSPRPAGSRPGAVRDRRGSGTGGTIGALVASGEPVLVVAADALLRREQSAGCLAGFEVCSWDSLATDPELAADVRHLVAIDPPLDSSQNSLLDRLSETVSVHLAWGEPELRCSRDALDRDLLLRPGLVAAYRVLRDGGDLSSAFGRMSARTAGRMLGVLAELRLVSLPDSEHSDAVSVPADPERAQLEDSRGFRDAHREHEERVQWLTQLSATTGPAIAA